MAIAACSPRDALLAATLIHHGATEIITCDPAGFEPFSELRVFDPRQR